MALVKTIKPTTKERHSVHDETECCSSVFVDARGLAYLQLDTYGSSGRSLPGKVSQAIQFDENAARQLKALIEATFPRLR